MACTTEQQSIPLMEISEPIECEKMKVLTETEVYDEESRQWRKFIAEREALRQLELRKTQALALAHRMSFIR